MKRATTLAVDKVVVEDGEKEEGRKKKKSREVREGTLTLGRLSSWRAPRLALWLVFGRDFCTAGPGLFYARLQTSRGPVLALLLALWPLTSLSLSLRLPAS